MRHPITLAIIALAIAAAGGAEARQRLVGASPAVGGQLNTGPRALSITFAEAVDLATLTVTLRGPGGEAVPIGAPALDPTNDHHITVPVPSSLNPGTYRVTWRAAQDGAHPIQGAYTFTVG